MMPRLLPTFHIADVGAAHRGARLSAGKHLELIPVDADLAAVVAVIAAELAVHQVAEAQAGVEDVEGPDGDGDHDALEADEEVLAGHEVARPAVAELGDAEYAAPEDADGAERERRQEPPEHARPPDRHRRRVLVQRGRAERPMPPQRVEEEVAAQEHEGEQGEDLEGEARDHDVVAFGRRLARVEGGGGEAAAGCLQDEGDYVAGDELWRLLVNLPRCLLLAFTFYFLLFFFLFILFLFLSSE